MWLGTPQEADGIQCRMPHPQTPISTLAGEMSRSDRGGELSPCTDPSEHAETLPPSVGGADISPARVEIGTSGWSRRHIRHFPLRVWFKQAETLRAHNAGVCKMPQARTGVSAPQPSFDRQETRPGPVAGFARSSRKRTARQRNPDGLRLLSRSAARYGRSRKAFLPPGRIRSRSIRQREQAKCGTAAVGGDKKGVAFG